MPNRTTIILNSIVPCKNDIHNIKSSLFCKVPFENRYDDVWTSIYNQKQVMFNFPGANEFTSWGPVIHIYIGHHRFR